MIKKTKEEIVQDRIAMIKSGTNPYFIAELQTGYVVIGDHQRFRGYTLFICKYPGTELHQLESEIKLEFLEEMSLVAECMFQAFKPDKLNYELLGNGDPLMHWHIFPRYDDDGVNGPVWWLPFEEMKLVLPKAEMKEIKRTLTTAIKNNDKINSRVINWG